MVVTSKSKSIFSLFPKKSMIETFFDFYDFKAILKRYNLKILKEDAYELYYWTYGPIIFRGSIIAYLLDQFIDLTLSKISAVRKKYGGRMGFLCQKV
ncbi:hypothetical protein C4E24_02435 [ANME-1 cluster archaeon AG-394-G21]|nr:hypothetical protein [ANME-1 cluster archaeon AG-394-G21]